MKTSNNSIKFFKQILIIIGIVTILLYGCKTEDCAYQIDEFPYSCNAGMDVAFLIDYTGSMGPAIDTIKSSVNAIANTIVTESGGDYRLSLSIFDETTEGYYPDYLTQTEYADLPIAQRIINTSGGSWSQYLTMMEKFGTANKITFSNQLAKLNNPMYLGGGINHPEPGGLLLNEILNNAFAGAWRTTNITKLAIIITDASAGGDDDKADGTDDTYLANLATTANAMGIQCILITTKSAGATDANYERSLIDNNTLGVKLTDADFNDISTDIISIIEDICVSNEE